MNIKSKLLLALLATSSAAFAQTAPAAPEVPEVTYNVGVVSQYRYRGLAQTKGDAALQGGADYANANGFYAGAWGSTIKWIKDAVPDTGKTAPKGPVELDLYGGYKFEAAGIAYDVGYLRYEYVGNTYKDAAAANVNASTDEAYAAATYGPATLKYSYAFSDLFGYSNSRGSSYVDLSATFDLGNGYSLVPHAGHQTVKHLSTAANMSYTDIALTLNKDLGDGLSASVSSIATNGKAATFQQTSAAGYNTAKNALVVGVKYAF